MKTSHQRTTRYASRVAAVALALAAVGWARSRGQGAQAPSPARAAADSAAAVPGPGALSTPNADPFPSTYRLFPSKPTLIKNVTIFTAAGPRIENGALLMRD